MNSHVYLYLHRSAESKSMSQKRPADLPEEENDTDVPFKMRKLPTFISISSNQEDTKPDQTSKVTKNTGMSS